MSDWLVGHLIFARHTVYFGSFHTSSSICICYFSCKQKIKKISSAFIVFLRFLVCPLYVIQMYVAFVECLNI